MQNGLFNVTEEQQSLVELIRDFMTKEIKPHVLEWEKEGHYPQEIIEHAAGTGRVRRHGTGHHNYSYDDRGRRKS